MVGRPGKSSGSRRRGGIQVSLGLLCTSVLSGVLSAGISLGQTNDTGLKVGENSKFLPLWFCLDPLGYQEWLKCTPELNGGLEEIVLLTIKFTFQFLQHPPDVTKMLFPPGRLDDVAIEVNQADISELCDGQFHQSPQGCGCIY